MDVLQQRKIAGAGLDVFETEPLPADDAFRQLPNVLATPHVGYVADDNYRATSPRRSRTLRRSSPANRSAGWADGAFNAPQRLVWRGHSPVSLRVFF